MSRRRAYPVAGIAGGSDDEYEFEAGAPLNDIEQQIEGDDAPAAVNAPADPVDLLNGGQQLEFELLDPDVIEDSLETINGIPDLWKNSWAAGDAHKSGYVKLFDIGPHPASPEHLASVRRWSKIVRNKEQYEGDDNILYDLAGWHVDINKHMNTNALNTPIINIINIDMIHNYMNIHTNTDNHIDMNNNTCI